MTLRARLVLVVVAVTVLSLGGAFAAVAAAVNRSELGQLDRALRAEAQDEAYRVSAGASLAEDDGRGAPDRRFGARFAAIYEDGQVKGATRTFVSPPPPFPLVAVVAHGADVPFDLALCGDATRAILVPVPGKARSSLLFAAPRRDVDLEAAFLGRAMILAFAVAVGWAGLVASWIVARLTRDNDAIAAVVRRVAGGDLSARVGRRGGDVARLASDVDEMVARLETLVDSQQRFVAHAAHELRSPLTTLYGELQLALRRSRDVEAYREAIGEALDATERLRTLAEDLLALARAGAQDDADHDEVSMIELVEGIVVAARGQATERGVTLTVDAKTSATARGRRRDLERLVQNVVDNAVRHCKRRGTVSVVLATSGSHVEVEVRDEGEGVPAHARERIFEPFFRLPRDRAAPGSGLGLSIAREIARAHGGDVWLAEGVTGAVFVTRLPLTRGGDVGAVESSKPY